MSWKRVVSIGAAFTACLLAGAAFGQSAAQRTAAARLPQLFTKQVAMIPMRDGVRLYTEIYRPRDASGPLPFLMARTPYGVHDDAQGYDRSLLALRAMWPAGYVFVFQDIRGRFRSEGKFVMLRFPCVPMHSGCMDEGTDT
ncbi:MAG: CocE/NonD family hydrolase, partial [Terriglobales bacterium]